MKKRSGILSKRPLLGYSVIGVFLILVFLQDPGWADGAAASKGPDPVVLLEETIRQLVDPFLPKVPQEVSVMDPVVQPEEALPQSVVLPENEDQVEMPPVRVFPEMASPEREERRDIREDMRPPVISLTGVIYQAERPMAILNGVVVKQGDQFFLGGRDIPLILEQVRKGGVTLNYNGRVFSVDLK